MWGNFLIRVYVVYASIIYLLSISFIVNTNTDCDEKKKINKKKEIKKKV
jgi:hypothetical protein